MKMMNFKLMLKKIRAVLLPDIWCCAVRFNKNSNTLMDDIETPFSVLPNTYRYWAADPFLAKDKNKYYLFFEMYDRLKRKGLLGCREISENGFGQMNIIYECSSHLSYPFIYEKHGSFYIVPESNKSGELFRLRCVDFPLKWEKEKVLFTDRLVDTTIYNASGKDFYISERVSDNNVFDRIDLFYEENGKLKECGNNPVKTDVNTARCAGKLFEYNGKLIRPSQNCGDTYGGKLNFNYVIELSENNYCEKFVSSISPNDIKLNCKNDFTGIHTYNKLDNIEVIDLKRKSGINFLNIAGALLKLLKR